MGLHPRFNGRGKFELLEDRQLLSTSGEHALSSVSSLVNPDDPAIAKIGYELATLSKLNSSVLSELLQESALTSGLLTRDNTVLIEAVANTTASELSEALVSLGMTDIATAGNLVSGFFPISTIDTLSSVGSLAFARPSNPVTNIGLANSQGDEALRGDVLRNYSGLNGARLTVGVLSDSFNTSPFTTRRAADDIVSGDLPGAGNPNNWLAPVNVLDEYVGGAGQSTPTDEGRAMLQIVHDVVPAAGLAYATAFEGMADFANNIRLLARDPSEGGAGARVIVDDVIYFT